MTIVTFNTLSLYKYEKVAHTFFKLLQYCLSYLLVHLLGANKTTWRLHEISINDFFKLDFFKRTFS